MADLRKYGVEDLVQFPLISANGSDYLTADPTLVTGDVKVSKDNGAFANTTNLPTWVGNGMLEVTLTATELTAKKIVVTIIDQTATKVFDDQMLLVETYGNTSAQHAFDLGSATPNVNVVQISGDTTSADNLELDYDGTGYAKANSSIGEATALGTQAKADVNAEVVDVLTVDTIAELTTITNASETIANMIQLMHMALRNLNTTDGSTNKISNDAGTTIATAVLSDDTVTFTKGEYS